MKHLAVALAVAAALFAASPLRAEVIDMSTLTCKELISMKTDDAGVVLFWLHGYYGGQANDPKLDMQDIVDGGRKIGAYCGEHPKETVFGAIKALTK